MVFIIAVLPSSFPAGSPERCSLQQSQIAKGFRLTHRPQLATAVSLPSANVHEVALIPSRVNIINTSIKRINQFLLHQISDGNKKCKQTLKDPSVFLVHLLHVGGAGFWLPVQRAMNLGLSKAERI